MIFTKDEARRIAAGRQTMILTPIALDPLTRRPKPSWARRFKIGEDLAVATMSKAEARRKQLDEEVCRILITEIVTVRLADLDLAAARALGHRTTAEMAADWMDRRDPEWPPLEEALCEHCDGNAELPDGEPCPNQACDFGAELVPADWPDDQIVQIFRQRHGQREMWAIHFVVPAELPRLLATPRAERAYTTKSGESLLGEPEAVDEVFQARLTKDARRNDQERRDDERRHTQREIDRRVSDLLREFGVTNPDGRDLARARESVIAAMRRQQKRAA